MPLFTERRRREILRTSPKRSSKKFGSLSMLVQSCGIAILRRSGMDASRNTDEHDAWRTIENPVEGVQLTFLETAQETGGSRIVLRMVVAPGGGVSPEVHTKFTESYEVLEGVLAFELGGSPIRLGPGDHAERSTWYAARTAQRHRISGHGPRDRGPRKARGAWPACLLRAVPRRDGHPGGDAQEPVCRSYRPGRNGDVLPTASRLALSRALRCVGCDRSPDGRREGTRALFGATLST